MWPDLIRFWDKQSFNQRAFMLSSGCVYRQSPAGSQEDEMCLPQQSPFKGWISGNVMTPRWLPSTCLPIHYNFLVYSGLLIGFFLCQSCLFSCAHSFFHSLRCTDRSSYCSQSNAHHISSMSLASASSGKSLNYSNHSFLNCYDRFQIRSKQTLNSLFGRWDHCISIQGKKRAWRPSVLPGQFAVIALCSLVEEADLIQACPFFQQQNILSVPEVHETNLILALCH